MTTLRSGARPRHLTQQYAVHRQNIFEDFWLLFAQKTTVCRPSRATSSIGRILDFADFGLPTPARKSARTLPPHCHLCGLNRFERATHGGKRIIWREATRVGKISVPNSACRGGHKICAHPALRTQTCHHLLKIRENGQKKAAYGHALMCITSVPYLAYGTIRASYPAAPSPRPSTTLRYPNTNNSSFRTSGTNK